MSVDEIEKELSETKIKSQHYGVMFDKSLVDPNNLVESKKIFHDLKKMIDRINVLMEFKNNGLHRIPTSRQVRRKSGVK